MDSVWSRLEALFYDREELEGLERLEEVLQSKNVDCFSIRGDVTEVNIDRDYISKNLESYDVEEIVYVEKPLGRWEIQIDYDGGSDIVTSSRAACAHNKGAEEGEWRYKVSQLPP
ncbi:hypothetical protein [Candidatus Nanohalobium constans]|uniref:Uncharacterized protein n=1 Tax=Candidatus Nanohalobium constans TaxID=2565781 RepID=A0A5Q0UEI9_9ARCH|nr:hypothetical protein [Candidatus Nanohalobium constans]QGA79972.1 hypothetical protein LC1Nh_0064 [Candidatus Nanohalobium constans]